MSRARSQRTAHERAKKNACTCGAQLPHHLANLANNDERFTHICSCERAYKVRSGKFVLVGTEHNPFARGTS